MGSPISRYLNPWAFRREQEEQKRIAVLRDRDGDNCRRCRRPIRFDLPAGHERGPSVEPTGAEPAVEAESLDTLCLCHRRCNADAGDNTAEVTDRVRRKSEAELFAKAREVRRAG